VATSKRGARATAGAPMRLRGTPRRLEGVLSVPTDSDEVEVDVEGLAVESITVRPLGEPGAPEQAWLRLALPPWTRPGEYRGTIRAGGRKEEVALHVEPRIRLRLSPRGLILHGRAGEQVAATVVVANLGNADCVIREVNAVGLFDVEGAERAVGRTFRSTDADGGRILARLAEELEHGYGGLARLTVAAGAGDLAPGEARELALTFHLPDGLGPGRVYEGAWALPAVNYMVRVEVAEGKPTRKEAR
jgi:hypothetical protein